MKKVKIAILRARHDTTKTTIEDQACIQMLMTNQTRTSVLNYWSDNTEGYLDFEESVMFPWVDITILATDTSRGTQIAKAYEATKVLNRNQDLVGFDGFIVLTYPGQMAVPNPKAGQPGEPATVINDFDGGATVFGDKPACALPVMTSDHTFMCHEVGHVLGFKHSYGVWNNGVDWDRKPPWDQGQVYGDPYDIMSSASFGTRNLDPTLSSYTGSPTFPGPSVVGWPFAGAVRMGPAPARAQVHHWDPATFQSSVLHLQTPNGVKHNVRLYAAGAVPGSPRRGQPRLVVIHPPNEDTEGRGRCYLEYRDTSGWDKGLDVTGNDLARQAVVAHTLADATGDGVRCWYRGHILVPLEIDSDLAITGTLLTVRVVDEDVNTGYVDIEIYTTNERGIDLRITKNDEAISSRDARKMKTPCDDTIVWATWTMQSSCSFQPSVYGIGGEGAPDGLPPLISWTVGGIQVPAGSGELQIPTSSGIFTIDFKIDPITAELSLKSRPGEKYSVTVVATATEPGGGNTITGADTFEPLGEYTGLLPEDKAKLDLCMKRFMLIVRLRPRDLLIPPGPDPYRNQLQDRINQARLGEIIRQITPTKPEVANALRTIANLRYGTIR